MLSKKAIAILQDLKRKKKTKPKQPQIKMISAFLWLLQNYYVKYLNNNDVRSG